jgi:hypothetical protein
MTKPNKKGKNIEKKYKNTKIQTKENKKTQKKLFA